MSAIRYEPREDHWEGDEEQDTLVIPGRPPRRRLGRAGVLLITLLVGAIGFYVGVRVEKGQIGSSSTAAAGTSAPTGAPAGFSGRTGASALNRFAGSGAAGGSSFGTVASLDGRTIYVKTVSGNTVKVRLVSATKVSKSLTVSRNALRPGDSVVVQGASGSNGTLTATSISDTGASSTSSSGSGSTGTGSTASTTGGSGSASGSSSLFGNTSGG
jgi:Domain of unknown function (DUF5666)